MDRTFPLLPRYRLLTLHPVSFTLSATLDDDASPPAYIVQSYTDHIHLDQQLCSSSPAQVLIPLPVVPVSAPAPTPNPMPPPRRRRSISAGPLRNAEGRFVTAEGAKTKKDLDASPLPFAIPLLPLHRRQRPAPRANVDSPTLADTDEYLVWKEVLGIKTNEIPSAWSTPAARGRELFEQWGWLPEGAEKELQEQEADQTTDQDSQAFEEEVPEEQDDDYQPLEEQPDPSSDDFYQPQPKRRRKSSSRAPPVSYGLDRPTTRSALRGSTRGSSFDASQSPEMRRGFWARDDDEEEAEATMTPETPFMELESRKRKRNHSSADEDASRALLELSSGGAEPMGLGLDLGAPTLEEDKEPETPAIAGTGFITRPASKLPFPCACHLGNGRPHLRIDTTVAEHAAIAASPQPLTMEALASQAPKAPNDMVQQQGQAFRAREALVAAIELTLPARSPPPLAGTEPTPPLPTPKEQEVFTLPSFKKRPPVAREHSVDSAPAVDSNKPSPAINESTTTSPVLASAAPPLTNHVLSANSAGSDLAVEPPAPLLFKPRRAPKLTSQKSYIAVKPTLKVALASAENATTSKVDDQKQEDVKPSVAPPNLLQQREEIKSLKARFYDGSESEIDPCVAISVLSVNADLILAYRLYCSAHLDHKLASLRSLGHFFSSNPAYTTLLDSHLPLRSRLPQPFLYVARDGPSSAPSPAAARPLNPRRLAATSYLWGRDLTREELEWLEREERGLWKLVEEMMVVREVNETWEKVGRQTEEKERERERERGRNDSPKRRYQHHSSPSGHGGGRKYGVGGGGGGGEGGRGRVWRKGAEPSRGGGWKPDPKGDRWAR